MKLLLTSAGIKNPTIHDALVDLLGKPTTECDALCIPTALYGHPQCGPVVGVAISSAEERLGPPTVGVGWKSMGVLELTAAAEPRMPSSGSPGSGRRTCCWSTGGDATYLCHWMRRVRAGRPAAVADRHGLGRRERWEHGDDARIGDDFVQWPSAPDDRTLGVVDFSIFPHLERLGLPGTRWRGRATGPPSIGGPAYAMDDETAIKVVDGAVEVVSEGHWKLLTQ